MSVSPRLVSTDVVSSPVGPAGLASSCHVSLNASI
jgi:hypothetical protein